MGWWFCLPVLLPGVCREACWRTGRQCQRSSFQLSALQKATAKSPVQVCALSCISWDDLKKKLQGFHRALGDSFVFYEKKWGAQMGVVFSAHFHFQWVLVAIWKCTSCYMESLFKPKYFCNDLPPSDLHFVIKAILINRKNIIGANIFQFLPGEMLLSWLRHCSNQQA